MYTPDKVGFDKIYVLHLPRRSERRKRLEAAMIDLKLDVSFFKGVDGKQIVVKRYKKVLILEDDATFFPMFRKQWSRIAADIDEFVPNWELIYLGRKALNSSEEKPVNGTQLLVWPDYSYWGVAYALSLTGAKKLVKQKLLSKLLPVDEFLPIMFNKHPEGKWKSYFSPKDLIAVSVNPLLIEPAWFPGDRHYISDTESSIPVNFTKLRER
ncbi:GLT25D [Mytilus coruscus]|uniref:GLT25D n=1 Tax=Mytilus coruscus TaxID=42192 RepID=A0A6J8BJP4_MYTCO|nr:GLT25D [Mytilus coruscus]